jgi:hypothetical protein
VSEEADGETQTAEVRTRDGLLLTQEALARHLEAIRIGARLRGVEAVVEGRLELRDGRAVLVDAAAGQSLRLAPLTTKVQWDLRRKQPIPATPSEQSAHGRLLTGIREGGAVVRVTGPLRRGSAADDVVIEVREFQRFTGTPPELPSVHIGISVSSPYGLGEPWSEARENLLQFPAIGRVVNWPNVDTSTAEVWMRDARAPDLQALDGHLRRAGIGAQLTGAEATLEGRLILDDSGLSLKPTGAEHAMPLAPLTRSVRWDFRNRAPIPASHSECHAHERLLALAAGRTKTVRVTGPLAVRSDGSETLLEVREFDASPRAAGLFARRSNRDTTPPTPMRSLRAIARDGGIVFLDWGNSEEPDFAGYNVYRSTRPGGRFKKVNRSPLTESEFEAKGAALTDQFVVKVVDRTGNESGPSPVADARPPAAPANLTAAPGDSVVFLRWDGVDDNDLDSYSIHRSETPEGPFAEICVGVLHGHYQDTGADNGITYYYVVTAVDGSSNISPFSNSASTTPMAAQQKVSTIKASRLDAADVDDEPPACAPSKATP